MYVAAQQVNRRLVDPHFRPQYDEHQDSRVDTYVRLEDLSTGLRAVEDRCGLPHIDLEKLSTSPHHNPATANHGWPTHAAGYPADRSTLEEFGTPPLQAFLDAETRLLVRTAYWTDYEAYGHYYDAAPTTALRMPSADRAKTVENLPSQVLRAA
jgi:hypothetical protein